MCDNPLYFCVIFKPNDAEKRLLFQLHLYNKKVNFKVAEGLSVAMGQIDTSADQFPIHYSSVQPDQHASKLDMLQVVIHNGFVDALARLLGEGWEPPASCLTYKLPTDLSVELMKAISPFTHIYINEPNLDVHVPEPAMA